MRDPFIEWLVSSLKPEERERARRMTTRDLRKLWGFSDGTARDNTDDHEQREDDADENRSRQAL